MSLLPRLPLALASLVLLAAPPAHAQCLRWESHLEQSTPDSAIYCFEVADLGTGPALYAGGQFTTVGGSVVNRIAQWDGTRWHALGSGVSMSSNAAVNDLVSFDDGGGTALYAAGNFNSASGTPALGFARWDGSAWSAPAPGVDLIGVHQMEVYDDGSGGAIYLGGYLIGSGLPAGANNLVRWDGSALTAVGGPNGIVTALAVFDDGSGAALYVARYLWVSTQQVGRLDRFDGSVWTPVAVELAGTISTLTSFNGVGGPALFAGGEFQHISGVSAPRGVARWDGAAWSDAGSGLPAGVGGAFELDVVDDVGGPALLLGGSFTGGAYRWNGAWWNVVGAGLLNGNTYAFARFDSGNGPELHAGGTFFSSPGTPLRRIARFDGSAWAPLDPPGDNQGLDGAVSSLAAFDDGSGPQLFAAGNFSLAGTAASNWGARWNGTSWAFAPLPNASEVLEVVPTTLGPRLYAGRSSVLTWSGSAWTIVPNSFVSSGTISALASYDSGAGLELIVGGSFPVAGSLQANGIARHDGTQYVAMGSGMNGEVLSLATYDSGSGPRLYAGGTFTVAGGVPAQHIAVWNGSAWSSIGTVTGDVYALSVFDDGSGAALYAGGAFGGAGGVPAPGVARWNGTTWSAVGSLSDGIVFDLAVFDDGSGPALYAAGTFLTSGAESVTRIAKWNGTTFPFTWTMLGSGLSGIARSLAAFDGGSGPSLFVGGSFGLAGDLPSANLARWSACTSAVESFCFGDGSLRPCPCGNEGLPAHGCDNSTANGGARLVASGTTIPDTIVLQSSGELPSALSIFLQGNALVSAGIRFGDGVRCAGGSIKRLYVSSASGGSVSAPGPGDPSITAQSAALGDPIAPGSIRYYQTYYRDPDPSFCPEPSGSTWNVTNGIRIAW